MTTNIHIASHVEADREWSGTEALMALAFLPLALAWGGFVWSTLWNWFVASAFGLPSLSVGQAAGIVLMMTALRRASRTTKGPIEVFFRWFIGSLFLLGFGWLIHAILL